jgi:hypothetical protein
VLQILLLCSELGKGIDQIKREFGVLTGQEVMLEEGEEH